MTFDPYTASGVLGVCCFILSYFATIQGWLPVSNWRFPAINLLGSSLVLISLTTAWNMPSAVLECFWAAVSVYGLVRSLSHPRR